jgi:hypothetical protein
MIIDDSFNQFILSNKLQQTNYSTILDISLLNDERLRNVDINQQQYNF